MKKKTAEKQVTTVTFTAWTPGGRGRPPVFQSRKDKKAALKVIKAHGIRQAALILGISRPVLAKLVKEAGVKLGSGRRRA